MNIHFESFSQQDDKYEGNFCNCVIFRLDDVQDKFHDSAQVKVMDLFLSNHIPLSLGLIMGKIGNDSKIVEKIKEGVKEKLFELDIHGWNHTEDFSKITYNQQVDLLNKSKQKMSNVFDVSSDIFIPPRSTNNNDTLEAMKQLEIKIISGSSADKNDYFIADKKNHEGYDGTVLHLPGLVKNMYQPIPPIWAKVPLKNVIEGINTNIGKYGYAVIILHPQNFVLMDNGKLIIKDKQVVDQLNYDELEDLTKLIGYVKSKNITITTLSNVAKGQY